MQNIEETKFLRNSTWHRVITPKIASWTLQSLPQEIIKEIIQEMIPGFLNMTD